MTGWLRTVSDVAFLGFGLWTVFCHLLVFSGRSFDELVWWSWLPVVALAAALWRARKPLVDPAQPTRCEPANAGAAQATGIPWPVALVIAAAIASVYYATRSHLLWWSLSIVFVALGLAWPASNWGARNQREPVNEPRLATWLSLGLLALLVFGAFVPSPNWESLFYMSMGVSSAQHPDRALLGEDWMHGAPGLPPLAFYYRAHSYEFLVATLSRLTGADQLMLFWEVFPRLAVALAIVVHWLALRQLGARPRAALLGLALASIVWISWGGPPRTLARWTFSAITSGKGMLVMLVVPAILYYAARYLERGDRLTWLLLACAVVSGIGLSSSGILVGPLTAACVLLAGLRRSRQSWIRVARGLVPLLYPALVGLAIVIARALETDANMLQQIADREPAPAHMVRRGFLLVLGVGEDGLRPYLALFSLLALPALPTQRASQRRLAVLVLAILLVALNPLTPVVLSKLAQNMWWRSFWSVPFPLLVGLAGALLADTGVRVGRLALGPLACAVLALAFLLAPQPWAVSSINLRRAALADASPYYVDRHRETADAVLANFGREDLVLAPTRVAMWLIALPRPPRLIAVRTLYARAVLTPLGRDEVAARRRLLALVDGTLKNFDAQDARRSSRFLANQIATRGISGVVLDDSNPLSVPHARVLEAAGFEPVHVGGGYAVWKARTRRSGVAVD